MNVFICVCIALQLSLHLTSRSEALQSRHFTASPSVPAAVIASAANRRRDNYRDNRGPTHRLSAAAIPADGTAAEDVSEVTPAPPTEVASSAPPSLWPCNDELDKRILGLSLPAVLNFAIVPLVGLVDTYWVGRMRSPLALAGQGAANQLFSSLFWILSFFPSVVTPLIARVSAAGDKQALRARVGETLLIGSVFGVLGTILLTVFPHAALNVVLPKNAPVREYAVPYLAIRGVTFLPALLSTICFAVYRGTLDVVSPLRISIIANSVNMALDPVCIFTLAQGVAGAAVATCVSEIVSLYCYLRGLIVKDMLRIKDLTRIPKWKDVKPLLVGGLSVQLRGLALNGAFLAVTRKTQALDASGTAAAAHAITTQLWQLGGIVLLAVASVASMLVPAELAVPGRSLKQARESARGIADRLMRWGVILGAALTLAQILALPLLTVFSPLPSVREAARVPSIVGALLQSINGVVFIGEGVQQGNQAFESLAATTMVAAAGMVASLHFWGSSLVGVWASFATFNFIRLAGVLHHHYIAGPLSPASIAATTT